MKRTIVVVVMVLVLGGLVTMAIRKHRSEAPSLLYSPLEQAERKPVSAAQRDVAGPPGSNRADMFPSSFKALMVEIAPSFGPDDRNVIGSKERDSERAVLEGKGLAAQYCSTCHLLPDPSILPKSAWLDVGSQTFKIIQYMDRISGETQTKATCAPRVTLALPAPSQTGVPISRNDYAKIFFYYYSTAPEISLPQAVRPPVSADPAPFHVKAITKSAPPYPVFLFASIAAKQQSIVLGNMDGNLNIYNKDAVLQHSIPLPGVPTGFASLRDNLYVTIKSHSLIDPSIVDGKIVRLPSEAILQPEVDSSAATVLSELRRPEDTRFADFNGDGMPDMLIEELGWREGSLSMLNNLGNGEFGEKQVLYDGAGALSSAIFDANGDGRLDFVSLIGFSEQAGFLFLNEGNGKFKRSTVVRQFPGFGYEQVLIGDMNRDKRDDIITVNGNTRSLLTYPLKNYHGVRILSNEGGTDYRERYFYPMYGAKQAITKDFDKDGDLDIVAIAVGPDFGRMPLETIIYLENKGGYNFTPHRIPEAENGRWYSMALGDLDQDGRDDLVLAAAYPEFHDKVTQGVFGNGSRTIIMILEIAK